MVCLPRKTLSYGDDADLLGVENPRGQHVYSGMVNLGNLRPHPNTEVLGLFEDWYAAVLTQLPNPVTLREIREWDPKLWETLALVCGVSPEKLEGWSATRIRVKVEEKSKSFSYCHWVFEVGDDDDDLTLVDSRFPRVSIGPCLSYYPGHNEIPDSRKILNLREAWRSGIEKGLIRQDGQVTWNAILANRHLHMALAEICRSGLYEQIPMTVVTTVNQISRNCAMGDVLQVHYPNKDKRIISISLLDTPQAGGDSEEDNGKDTEPGEDFQGLVLRLGKALTRKERLDAIQFVMSLPEAEEAE